MKTSNFYEVTDHRNDALWGGVSALQAVEWFRRGLDYKVYVSVWEEKDDDAVLVTDKIEVTALVLATITSEMSKG